MKAGSGGKGCGAKIWFSPIKQFRALRAHGRKMVPKIWSEMKTLFFHFLKCCSSNLYLSEKNKKTSSPNRMVTKALLLIAVI